MSRYEITITEHTTEKRNIGHSWEQGGTVKSENGWGYTPIIESEVAVKREILRQNVETLDLTTVIKAINGIK